MDARDVASVAVAALTEDGYYGQTCDITGPEALSFGDAAGIFPEVLGKPVRYVDVPPAAAVTSTIAGAAKIRPHTFRDFVRDYASRFRD